MYYHNTNLAKKRLDQIGEVNSYYNLPKLNTMHL